MFMTGIFGILESSAMQWYQDVTIVTPTQDFFFIVISIVYGSDWQTALLCATRTRLNISSTGLSIWRRERPERSNYYEKEIAFEWNRQGNKGINKKLEPRLEHGDTEHKAMYFKTRQNHWRVQFPNHSRPSTKFGAATSAAWDPREQKLCASRVPWRVRGSWAPRLQPRPRCSGTLGWSRGSRSTADRCTGRCRPRRVCPWARSASVCSAIGRTRRGLETRQAALTIASGTRSASRRLRLSRLSHRRTSSPRTFSSSSISGHRKNRQKLKMSFISPLTRDGRDRPSPVTFLAFSN